MNTSTDTTPHSQWLDVWNILTPASEKEVGRAIPFTPDLAECVRFVSPESIPFLAHWFKHTQTGDLICTTYNSLGFIAALRLIHVNGEGRWGKYHPQGESTKGLMLANSEGVRFIQGRSTMPPDQRRLGVVAITEGEADWLTWCALRPDLPAFGLIGAGCFSDAWGRALYEAGNLWEWSHSPEVDTTIQRNGPPTPSAHIRYALLTDRDKAGHGYADEIHRTLFEQHRGFLSCQRWDNEESQRDALKRWAAVWRIEGDSGPDQNDLLKAGRLLTGADPLAGCRPMPPPTQATAPTEPTPRPPTAPIPSRPLDKGINGMVIGRVVARIRKAWDSVLVDAAGGNTHAGKSSWVGSAIFWLRAAHSLQAVAHEVKPECWKVAHPRDIDPASLLNELESAALSTVGEGRNASDTRRDRKAEIRGTGTRQGIEQKATDRLLTVNELYELVDTEGDRKAKGLWSQRRRTPEGEKKVAPRRRVVGSGADLVLVSPERWQDAATVDGEHVEATSTTDIGTAINAATAKGRPVVLVLSGDLLTFATTKLENINRMKGIQI